MLPKPKEWNLLALPPAAQVRSLADELRQADMPVPQVLTALLLQRGITTPADAATFFYPSWDQLHDPFLMKGMHEAIATLDETFRRGERLLVLGDYDVDGTAACAIAYHFFNALYPGMVGFYIPLRDGDGYGFSIPIADKAVVDGYSTILMLDFGTTACEAIAHARGLGLRIVVGDHHLPEAKLPPANALLNPKQPGCTYPYKELSGAGVSFKLIQGYTRLHRMPEIDLYEYTDLLAISIAADLVAVTGENRVLARFGLERLYNEPRPGLKALQEKLQRRRALSLSDIIHTIAPRINAVGRMGDAGQAVRLLLAPSLDEARKIAESIDVVNAARKTVDGATTRAAFDMAELIPDMEKRKSVVVHGRGWHKGVIGIVASRLVDAYYRPTVVLSEHDGALIGSARSIKGYDIHSALAECAAHLTTFGGHTSAAGLSLPPENIDAFAAQFESVVARTLDDALMVPRINLDAQITLEQITPAFYHWLSLFAPHGPGNLQPLFLSHGVYADTMSMRIVGASHLQVSLMQRGPQRHPAVAFGMGESIHRIHKGMPFDAAYTLEEETWNERTTIKLHIKDLKFAFN